MNFCSRFARRSYAILLALVCLVASGAFAQGQGGTAHGDHADPAHAWTYSGDTGPEHWADLSPDFARCGSGKLQSPIDIVKPTPAELPPIHFEYHASPLKVIDNGHTIQVNYAKGSSIVLGGKRYDLVQFHFHHPAEEAIDGQHAPMVVHLVHQNVQGKQVVVAVEVKEGAPNQLIGVLWDNLPATKGKEVENDAVQLEAIELIPANHAYTTLIGSLTTPPCTEGVIWLVLNTPMSFSKAQIDRFAGIYPDNARPIQPLNGRPEQTSK